MNGEHASSICFDATTYCAINQQHVHNIRLIINLQYQHVLTIFPKPQSNLNERTQGKDKSNERKPHRRKKDLIIGFRHNKMNFVASVQCKLIELSENISQHLSQFYNQRSFLFKQVFSLLCCTAICWTFFLAACQKQNMQCGSSGPVDNFILWLLDL